MDSNATSLLMGRGASIPGVTIKRITSAYSGNRHRGSIGGTSGGGGAQRLGHQPTTSGPLKSQPRQPNHPKLTYKNNQLVLEGIIIKRHQ